MSISRAMRSLAFVVIFGISPVLLPGDPRHLPFDVRTYFFELFVFMFAGKLPTEVYHYYFPQYDSKPYGPTELTQAMDNLWLEEADAFVLYVPVIITTLDDKEFELSPEELVALQALLWCYHPTHAKAVAKADNQHNFQIEMSSLQLNFLLNIINRQQPNEPSIITTSDKGKIQIPQEELIQLTLLSPVLAKYIETSPRLDNLVLPITSKLLNLIRRVMQAEKGNTNTIFESHSPEDLEKMRDEAEKLKYLSLKAKINRFLNILHRKSPRTEVEQVIEWPDTKLATFLQGLDLEQEKNRALVLALINRYISEGLSRTLDADLSDAIYTVIYNLNDKVDGGTTVLGTQFSEVEITAQKSAKS